MSDLKMCDLCSGIGGMHLAGSQAGFRTVFAADIDEAACRVYEANLGLRPAGDLAGIDPTDVPGHDLLVAAICKGIADLQGHRRAVAGRASDAAGGGDGMNEVRVCDMFAGIGGVTLAFRQAGYCPVFACELDPACRRLYAANHGLEPAGDIAGVDPDEVPDHEVLAASPPCTPHSRAGLRAGHDDGRSHVLVHLLRIMSARKPPVVMVENSADMAGYGGGRGLRLVRECLRGLGYRVSWRVLRALDLGAARHRARAFVVGSRTARAFDFDALRTRPAGRIADILDPSVDGGWLDHGTYVLLERPRLHRSGRIFAGFVNGPRRNPAGDPTLAWTHDASRQVYSPDGLGPTLTAQNNTRFRVLVGGRVRRVTIPECRRYMGFPDGYEVGEAWAQARLGNSVYVPLVRELARQVATQLLGVRVPAMV